MTASTQEAGPSRHTRSQQPRVTKRRAGTGAGLMDVAFRVIAEMGFGTVRIDDVCQAAGYTRGALYSQFDSLAELFSTLHDEGAQIIAAQVAETLVGDTTDLEAAIERVGKQIHDRLRLRAHRLGALIAQLHFDRSPSPTSSW